MWTSIAHRRSQAPTREFVVVCAVAAGDAMAQLLERLTLCTTPEQIDEVCLCVCVCDAEPNASGPEWLQGPDESLSIITCRSSSVTELMIEPRVCVCEGSGGFKLARRSAHLLSLLPRRTADCYSLLSREQQRESAAVGEGDRSDALVAPGSFPAPCSVCCLTSRTMCFGALRGHCTSPWRTGPAAEKIRARALDQ